MDNEYSQFFNNSSSGDNEYSQYFGPSKRTLSTNEQPATKDNSLSTDAADVGRLALQGISNVGGTIGYGLEKTGLAPSLGRKLQDSDIANAERLQSRLSPAMQEAAKQPLINPNYQDNTEGGSSYLNPNFGLRSVVANVVPSIPGSLAMGVFGTPLAKAASLGLKATGAGIKGAAIGAKTAQALDTIGSGIGYGASEGMFSAAQNAEQWGAEQRAKPIETFAQHPGWKAALQANNNDPLAAKEALINQGQSDIFKDTSLKTGALSAFTGGGMYGALRKGFAQPESLAKVMPDSFAKATAKSIAAEAGQEAPQSYYERKTTNQATKDYVDPNQDVNEGAWNDALIGGLSGGVMGIAGGVGNIGAQAKYRQRWDDFQQAADATQPHGNWQKPEFEVKGPLSRAATTAQQTGATNATQQAAATADPDLSQRRANGEDAGQVEPGMGTGRAEGAGDHQQAPAASQTVSNPPEGGNDERFTEGNVQHTSSAEQNVSGVSNDGIRAKQNNLADNLEGALNENRSAINPEYSQSGQDSYQSGRGADTQVQADTRTNEPANGRNIAREDTQRNDAIADNVSVSQTRPPLADDLTQIPDAELRTRIKNARNVGNRTVLDSLHTEQQRRVLGENRHLETDRPAGERGTVEQPGTDTSASTGDASLHPDDTERNQAPPLDLRSAAIQQRQSMLEGADEKTKRKIEKQIATISNPDLTPDKVEQAVKIADKNLGITTTIEPTPTQEETRYERQNANERPNEETRQGRQQETLLTAEQFDSLSSDGLPLKRVEGNTYIDHNGDEVQDDYATPAKPEQIQSSIDALRGQREQENRTDATANRPAPATATGPDANAVNPDASGNAAAGTIGRGTDGLGIAGNDNGVSVGEQTPQGADVHAAGAGESELGDSADLPLSRNGFPNRPEQNSGPTSNNEVERDKNGYAKVKLNGSYHFVTPSGDSADNVKYHITDKNGSLLRNNRSALVFNTEDDAINFASKLKQYSDRQEVLKDYPDLQNESPQNPTKTTSAQSAAQNANPDSAQPVAPSGTQAEPVAEAVQPVLSKTGKPFSRADLAQKALEGSAFPETTATHEVVPVKGGYGLAPKKLNRGIVGGKISKGEAQITASGRVTTPHPGLGLARGNVNKADRWLIENAALEAEARGDKFNARTFRSDLTSKIIPQASKDSAEEYLFGQQPEVQRPFTRPLSETINQAKGGVSNATLEQPANDSTDAGKRPRKLTDKTKFTISNDGLTAYIYATKKDTGKLEKAFIAHPSVIDLIRNEGVKSAADKGLLKPYKQEANAQPLEQNSLESQPPKATQTPEESRAQPAQPVSQEPAKSPVDEKTLIDHDLLKEDFRSGRWKYKFNYDDNNFFTANSKADAIERASEAFNKKPESERLTRTQKAEIANKERYNKIDALYRGKSIPELEQEVQRIDAQINGLQKAGRREFTGNNTRRTSAAVSNQGARDLGQFKLDLQSYIAQRKAIAQSKTVDGTINTTTPPKPMPASSNREVTSSQDNKYLAKLNKELEALLEKRSKMREAHMAKYRNGSATRAQTTTHNARVTDLNEQIEAVRKQIKEISSSSDIAQPVAQKPAATPEVKPKADTVAEKVSSETQSNKTSDVYSAWKDFNEGTLPTHGMAETGWIVIDNNGVPHPWFNSNPKGRAQGRVVSGEKFKLFKEYLYPRLSQQPQKESNTSSESQANTQATGIKDSGEVSESQANKPEIVEHTTGKGKVIRGIVRNDLTKADAQKIDPYTFKKDNGWFIREKHLGELPATKAVSEKPIAQPKPAVAEKSKQEAQTKAAAKLRQVAQSTLDKATAEQNRERATHTPRMARMASGSLEQARKDEALAKTMMNLADAIESGEAKALSGIKSKTQVEMLNTLINNAMYAHDKKKNLSYMEQERQKGRPATAEDIEFIEWPVANIHEGNFLRFREKLKAKRGGVSLAASIHGYTITPEQYQKIKQIMGDKEAADAVGWWPVEALARQTRLKLAGINNLKELKQAANEFLKFKEGAKKADPIKAAEMALVGQKLGIDFFPTPKSLASKMADMAGIKAGMRVLEPSAGNGNLADAAKANGAKVDVIEISPALRNVLDAKGYDIVAHDFADYKPAEKYDAIIMNPPFSNGQDAEHIQKAYDMLKPGGKLVAIAGEGIFFRNDKKATAFREWIDEQAADVEKLPANTFQDKTLLNTTGANARLIEITKPTDAKFSQTTQPSRSTVAELTAQLDAADKKLLQAKKLEIVQKASEVSDSAVSIDANGIEGWYDPKTGKVYVVADNVTPSTLRSTLNHEYLHAGLAENTQLRERIMGAQSELRDIFAQVEAGKYTGRYKAIYDAAMKRVERANTPSADRFEEWQAYSISEWHRAPQSLPERLAKAIQNLIASIKAAIYRYTGVPVGRLSPADLSALARSAMNYSENPNSSDSPVMASIQGAQENSVWERFKNLVSDVLSGKEKPVIPLVLSKTSPEQFLLSGMSDLPVTTSGAVINKAHYDHGIPQGVLEDLPALLSNPVMIFDSDTEGTKGKRAYVVVTEKFHNGNPIIAAIHADKEFGRIRVNYISTSLPKDNPLIMDSWYKKGLLRYVDESKIQSWSTTAQNKHPRLAQGQFLRVVHSKKGFGKSVSTQNDLVNSKSNDIRYSLADDAFADVPADDNETWSNQVKHQLDKATDAVFKQRFAFLSVKQMAEVAKRYAPGLKDFARLLSQREAMSGDIMRQGDRLITETWNTLDKKTRGYLAHVINQSTVHDVDASQDWYGVKPFTAQGERKAGFNAWTQAKIPESQHAKLTALAQRHGAIQIFKNSVTFATEQEAKVFAPILSKFAEDANAKLHIDGKKYQINSLKKAYAEKIAQAESNEQQHRLAMERDDKIQSVQKRVSSELERKLAHQDLKRKLAVLPPKAREVYRQTNQQHTELFNARLNALFENIDAAILDADKRTLLKNAIRLKFETDKLDWYYAPLSRFGRYWVYADKNGEREFATYETAKGRDERKAQLEKEGYKILGDGTSLDKNLSRQMDGTSDKFVQDVQNLIGQSLMPEQAQELQEQVYQMYLETLPDVSMRKHSIHRQGTPGYEKDAQRTFANSIHHGAKQLANMQISPKMRDVLELHKDALDVASSPYKRDKLLAENEAASWLQQNWIPQWQPTIAGAPELAQSIHSRYPSLSAEDGKEAMQRILDKNNAIMAAAEKIGKGDKTKLADILNELQTSYNAMQEGNSSAMDRIAVAMNQANFLAFMGFNLSSMFVNTLQTPIVAVPLAGGKYGYDQASKQFSKAFGEFMAALKNKQLDEDGNISIAPALSGDERLAMDEFKKFDISRTQAFDLIGVGEQGENYGGLLHNLSKRAGWMFHHSERMNREVTLLAAYRLARKAGQTHEQALESARELNDDAHLDYSSENAARIFRGPIARVSLQFKKYTQGMYYIWAKTALDAAKPLNRDNFNSDAEFQQALTEKRQALRSLAGMFVMQGAFAGAMGMPMMGAALAAANLLGSAVDGDDEPWDLERDIRIGLHNLVGPALAETISKGLFNTISPIDLSSRLDLSDVFFRPLQRDLEGKDAADQYLIALLGPTGGNIGRIANAAKLMGDGYYARAAEQFVPTAVTNLLKSVRYGVEDAKSMQGVTLKDMSAAEIAFQALGFSSSELNRKYDERSYILGKQRYIQDARLKLLHKAADAKQAGEIIPLEEIRDWNQRYPTKKITMENIRQSIKTQKRRAKERGDRGFNLDKKLRYLEDEFSLD